MWYELMSSVNVSVATFQSGVDGMFLLIGVLEGAEANGGQDLAGVQCVCPARIFVQTAIDG